MATSTPRPRRGSNPNEATEGASARSRILDAADRLFYQEGIGAVGVDAIVAESGAAKMSLYKHFGSKDELVAEYLRRHAALGLVNMQPVGLQPGTTPRERLLAIFDALATWFGGEGFNGCALLNASGELTDPHHPGVPVIRQYLRDKRAIVADMAAELEVEDAEALADQLVTLIHGATVLAGADQDLRHAQQAKAAAAALIDAAMRGTHDGHRAPGLRDRGVRDRQCS